MVTNVPRKYYSLNVLRQPITTDHQTLKDEQRVTKWKIKVKNTKGRGKSDETAISVFIYWLPVRDIEPSLANAQHNFAQKLMYAIKGKKNEKRLDNITKT